MELTLRDIPEFVAPWCFAASNPGHEAPPRRQARQALIQLKLQLMRAASEVRGESGWDLRHRIHEACEPIELWQLQQTLLQAMPADCPRRAEHQQDIQHALQALFSHSGHTYASCEAPQQAGGTHDSAPPRDKAFGHRRRDD
ncbi:MAG: hypothetical protein JOY60_07035 [Burkholderiaceae bacterium]|nr:hypothetical protein [Roseateles sp.]MBV8469599.1 hypothetical protein [Burkholderiaceae bacterium]